MKLSPLLTGLLAGLLMLGAVSPGFGADEKALPRALPDSSSSTIEEAASSLAEGRMADAAQGFEAAATNSHSPPFVRSLALFGLARTAWEQKDAAAAVKWLSDLAAQEELPATYRERVVRWISEINRQEKGLPARDAAAYRTPLPTLGKPGAIFQVVNSSGRSGDGSKKKPFSSLQQARDAIRLLKQRCGGSLPKGGVRVTVHGGAYPVSATLKLTAEDSGTADSPVVYQAKAGEVPVFSGGVRLQGWKPISDPGLRDKLDPEVRGRVLESNLAGQGIKDWGDPTTLRKCPELFCDGVAQTLARWPNEEFVTTGEVLGTDLITNGAAIAGCKDGKFRYVEDRPDRWVDEPDVRLYGYWYWDWFEEYQRVATIDPQSHTLTLAPPFSNYGYRKGQRYRAVNVFREIDRPGEWYLDRRSGMVYWLPPEKINPDRATVTLSCFADPFIAIENAEHVILQGLVFETGRGDAVHIQGGSDCLVAGCTIRQCGGDAIVIEGGCHHGVFGCSVTSMGCGGMRVNGGDRKTLTPGHHYVENCTVSDISRLKRTYTPAVLLDGYGNRIAHNQFERMPSSALRIEGNDQVIELNLIRNVVQESDDQGGLDCFGNPLFRGLVIRWNHWQDITGGTHCGAAGVRLDDMISGVAIYGNIFERCGAVLFGGVQVHGGKENLVDGNLFLDCFAGVSFSRWGEKRWIEAIRPFLQQADSAPYLKRYPDLARLKQDADVNYICRNVFSHCSAPFRRDADRECAVLNLATSRVVEPSELADAKRIRRDPQLRRLLIDPIPISEIGPYAHPWRAMK